MEGLQLIFSLQFVSVCVCVCMCVSGSFLVNKIPDERMLLFGHSFRLTVAYCLDSDPIEIGDLESKVKVTVTQYQFLSS